MKPARLLLVTVVVLALVGLSAWWPGRPEPEPSSVQRPLVPAAAADADGTVSWYCAAGRALLPTAPVHTVLVTNPGEAAVEVRLSASGPDGPVGEPTVVVVPPRAPVAVDVAAAFGAADRSVLVESPDPSLVVEHRLASPEGADQDLCATFSSSTWFFPLVNTERGAGALLTLYNPFPGDAGLDVEVVLDAGSRVPTPLSGIVVPARSAVVVDLGGSVQRRERFAAVVRLRSGRVVAELSQSLGPPDGDGAPQGLRLSLGIPEPSTRWVFAGGFTGPGAAESLVLHNPGDERAEVAVAVTPYGAAAAAPEPITVEVPAGRTAVLDLSAESRVPGEGYHAVTVDSPGRPVVVARALTVSGAGAAPTGAGVVGRPEGLARGWSLDGGSPVGALRWLVAAAELPAPGSVVLVHNPGSAPTVVRTAVLAGGVLVPVGPAGGTEVAAGDSLVVSVPTPEGVAAPAVAGPGVSTPAGTVAVVVDAGSPVVVERLVSFGPEEFALGAAAAVALPSAPLAPLDRP